MASHRKISRSLEATRSGVHIFLSLWNMQMFYNSIAERPAALQSIGKPLSPYIATSRLYKDGLSMYGIAIIRIRRSSPPSYLYNDNPYTSRTMYFYWDSPLVERRPHYCSCFWFIFVVPIVCQWLYKCFNHWGHMTQTYRLFRTKPVSRSMLCYYRFDSGEQIRNLNQYDIIHTRIHFYRCLQRFGLNSDPAQYECGRPIGVQLAKLAVSLCVPTADGSWNNCCRHNYDVSTIMMAWS